MEAILNNKTQINSTFNYVREFSVTEKQSPLCNEEVMNLFLDKVLEFQSFLKDKTNRINTINSRIESLTWFENITDENLLAINDIISASRDLHTTLIRLYVRINNKKFRSIAKTDISVFKLALDDFREIFNDLESVYFLLPKMPEFIETTKQLELV